MDYQPALSLATIDPEIDNVVTMLRTRNLDGLSVQVSDRSRERNRRHAGSEENAERSAVLRADPADKRTLHEASAASGL